MVTTKANLHLTAHMSAFKINRTMNRHYVFECPLLFYTSYCMLFSAPIRSDLKKLKKEGATMKHEINLNRKCN